MYSLGSQRGGGKDKNRCVFGNDPVNMLLNKMDEADAMIVGSPVFFLSPNEALLVVLDRMFMGRAGSSA